MRIFPMALVLFVFSSTSLLVAQSTSPLNPNWIRSVAWNSTGTQIAFTSQAGNIQVLNSETGEAVLALKFDGVASYPLDWKPYSPQLAVGTGDETQILDIATGKVIRTLPRQRGVRNLFWNSDGTQLVTASVSYPDNVNVWDIATGEIVFSPVVGDVLSVAWSPDETILAIGRFGEIELWHVASQQQVAILETSYDVIQMAWSPDGSKMASSHGYVPDDIALSIWNVATGEQLKTFKGHTDVINSVKWSPSGDLLASASHDHTVRVWDVASGEELELYQSQDSIFGASFSPYGGRLAFGITTSDKISNLAFANGSIQVVVPAPSLERLQSIQSACLPSATLTSLPIADTLDTDLALTSYIEAVRADSTIPVGCAADLIAVAEALQD